MSRELEEKVAEAEAECDRLREEAHSAPRSVPGGFQSAWSNASRHWMEACDRRDELRAMLSASALGGKADG